MSGSFHAEMKVSIIGAGAFGSALAEMAGRCGAEVLLWAHDPNVAAEIASTRSNPTYLPGAMFSEQMKVTSSLREALEFSSTVVMVTPSHHYRAVLTEILSAGEGDLRILSATKGIEVDSHKRMSEVTSELAGERLLSFGSLSGPTFAAEMSRNDPTTAVFASLDDAFAMEVQQSLSCRTFRIYRSTDVIGVELSGSLKNVIAIAAGVVEGIGLGSNTTAALITRGLHEMRRLGAAVGARPETFSGLAGMGDLVLTCTGSLSRNRSLGVALGKGRTLDEVLAGSIHVAEGVRTCRAAMQLSEQHQIELPIIREMYRLLYEGETPREAITRLMTRSLKTE